MTVRQQIEQAVERLSELDNPQLEAEVLAAHALAESRSFVIAHGSDELELPGFDQLVARRRANEPLAYIVGWREFYGRRFRVTPDVLVPRQETEALIETALKEQGVHDVLDIGTGSGCIAITLAMEKPEWSVTAVDVSAAALAVAITNASRLGVNPATDNKSEVSTAREDARPPEPPNQPEPTRTNPNLEFCNSDLFSNLDDKKFDLIVSNPPYVATDDELPPDVRDHEPHLALFAGEDGLDIYKRLAQEAMPYLRTGGALMVEIGDGQSESVQELFKEHDWHVEGAVKDLSGTERVLVCRPLVVGTNEAANLP